MIRLTRLAGSSVLLNCDLVETVESTPDSVITLINGHKLVVKESPEQIVEKALEFRARAGLCPLLREGLLGMTQVKGADEAVEDCQ